MVWRPGFPVHDSPQATTLMARRLGPSGHRSKEAKRSVEPTIEWFLPKFNVDLHNTLSAFKAARIMCPVTVQWLRPTPANVEALRQFPFLDSNDVINDLVTELPNYVATAQDIILPCEEDKVKWWRQQSGNLPHWSSAVMKVLLAGSPRL